MSEVKSVAAVIFGYAYDGFGRRIKKNVASDEIIHYHYDLKGNSLAETKNDATLLRKFINLIFNHIVYDPNFK